MTQLDDAIAQIDAANALDPNTETFEGESYPKEVLYSRRMTAWLEKVSPEAEDFMQIAARAQHIRRWEIPRTDYPEGKKGYHHWRTTLYGYHADKAAEIMRNCGYDEEVTEKMRQLLLRRNLRSRIDMQTLEDVICLVFLENYFADFSSKYDEEKMIGIIQRTWAKMTPRGHEIALTLDIPEEPLNLVKKALAAE
ncbi:MAG: DUF4202 domain-containing protein [Rhodospirillaceae bacterium]|jgi:hypothetical protein|nr:DUF4202 domain-containing protein [Rhodospirillaceae bacterium]MBT4589193.1 DUF4202 domain-containing protein [Rhodospirillaceae bacterium]MBT4940607.1 DUF4202 domain-containing protein [Rhodospirillaceae bacterium]MBT5941756.1 DUF4202 domain-containing protein [Rhodospirillaceae bacterium]MBT7267666.1 DUF4202 domain-containing protein [Rhodospirillaceae bacterium]